MFILSIKFALNINGGELFNILLEKIISLVFPALNVTFHLRAQIEILFKSLLSCSAVSAGSYFQTSKCCLHNVNWVGGIIELRFLNNISQKMKDKKKWTYDC